MTLSQLVIMLNLFQHSPPNIKACGLWSRGSRISDPLPAGMARKSIAQLEQSLAATFAGVR